MTSTIDDKEVAAEARPRVRSRSSLLNNLLIRYGVIAVWIVEIVVFSILEPDTFFSTANASSILSSQAPLLVLALALVPTLVAAEIDLSVASTMALSATVLGQLNTAAGWDIWICILAALGAAVLVGAINGLLTVYVGVQGIIVTLGMGTLLIGLSVWISGSRTIGGVSTDLGQALNTQFLGVSAAFYYAAIMSVALWYVYRHTPIGRRTLFVGQSREVARLSGVSVNRIRVGAFMLTSLLAGLAGVMVIGISGGLQPTSLGTLLLPAFAAAFLGSAIFEPGRVNPLGTIVALLFLATGISGLILLGLDPWIRDVFYGSAVIVAVTVSRLGALRSLRR